MKSFFTSEFFTGNRARLRALAKSELIIVASNGSLQRNGDTTFPFRQDSNFWYLTGISEPDIILVIDGPKEYLIIPEREMVREQFDGKLDNELFSRRSGIKKILPAKAGRDRLYARLRQVKAVAMPLPAAHYLKFHGFYTNPARATLSRRVKRINPALTMEDLRLGLARMRSIKQPAELKAIKSAIGLTLTTLDEISQHNFKEFSYEYEVEAALTGGFRKRGANGLGFAPIVASGDHACQIHHIENNGTIKKGSQILLDVGAEVENYSSDISRTYFIGRPTKRYEQVYKAVQDVYDFALGQLKPGTLVREYEKVIERFMGEKLRELGLIASLERKAIRYYYPHATSHFLGLDTHDAGDYEMPLEPDMVLTVEPGIYIPEEGIGIRIEDDVLITRQGNKVLSQRLS